MNLAVEARRAARLLKSSNQRVVFAESCTGGLASAQLARVPGISEHHCGSLVSYRNRSKQDWLSVPAKLLRDPGPISEVVASKMAEGALKQTREAGIAVSVTGHLGPDAPQRLDGLVFLGVAVRLETSTKLQVDVCRHRLKTVTRYQRQREAAWLVHRELCRALMSLV